MSRLRIIATLALCLQSLACPAQKAEPRAMNEKHDSRQNRLAREKSPYLLQHAANPVDWFPWCPEAFETAKRLDKPVFLSIGYSTCHWCHVMAEESFEDPEVARLLNDAFVCVKVDREERPDVDGVYMTVCQALTGGGGWPLTIVMTPDKRPFFAATYIPKKTRFGRLGLLELIPRITHAWRTQRDKLVGSADQIAAALRQGQSPPALGATLGLPTLEAAARLLAQRFDATHGGFSDAPKFPTPHNLTFLLRHWKRTGNAESLAMVERTLQAMRSGGIYDHLGFGFHRYSTDTRWLLPHFEKMLYDQALLALAYTEASQATGKPEYQQTAREILTYVLRDLTSPQGAFFSAEDADAEGEEGRFYLWPLPEVARLLAPEDAALATALFGLEREGNYVDPANGVRTGLNILHLRRPVAPDEAPRFAAIREELFAARQRRIRPHRDDKVLTDWNGLMIAALARAAQAFDEPLYAEAARRAADFALHELRRPDGRLRHAWRDGTPSPAPAHADDYAFLTWGLLELYEAVLEPRYLEAASELNTLLLAHHWDAAAGGLFFTADDGEELLFRQKEAYDGAVPSANSVALLNLLRLSRITGQAALEERAAKLQSALAPQVAQMPIAYTQFLVGLDFALGPSHEVVIAGQLAAEDTRVLLRALRSAFLPNKVVLFRPEDDAAPLTRLAPYTAQHKPIGGRATAYVCTGGACRQPTADPREMLAGLGVASAPAATPR